MCPQVLVKPPGVSAPLPWLCWFFSLPFLALIPFSSPVCVVCISDSWYTQTLHLPTSSSLPGCCWGIQAWAVMQEPGGHKEVQERWDPAWAASWAVALCFSTIYPGGLPTVLLAITGLWKHLLFFGPLQPEGGEGFSLLHCSVELTSLIHFLNSFHTSVNCPFVKPLLFGPSKLNRAPYRTDTMLILQYIKLMPVSHTSWPTQSLHFEWPQSPDSAASVCVNTSWDWDSPMVTVVCRRADTHQEFWAALGLLSCPPMLSEGQLTAASSLPLT